MNQALTVILVGFADRCADLRAPTVRFNAESHARRLTRVCILTEKADMRTSTPERAAKICLAFPIELRGRGKPQSALWVAGHRATERDLTKNLHRSESGSENFRRFLQFA